MKRARRIPLTQSWLKQRARRALAADHWRPLTLAWRMRLRGRSRQIAQLAGSAVRHTWSPRLSLQVSLAYNLPARSHPAAGLPNAATSILWRRSPPLTAALGSPVRSLLSETTRHLHRTLKQVLVQYRTFRTVTHSKLEKSLRSARLQLRTICSSSRIGEVGASQRPTRWHLPADAAGPHRHLSTVSSTWSHVARCSVVNRTEMVLGRTQLDPPSLPRAAAQLVWRTQLQPDSLEDTGRSIMAAIPVSPTFDNPGNWHTQGASGTPGLPPTRMLDPAQIDRLAEDVIGRVERRIRIERERQGA